ncbi:hypothetical protein [Planococcus sp. ISL-109]|uniref:hypothetical protein n=1 Tax=Planococcus sp. ISL-109 TaxID=2819166 RepID=UPI001BE859B3|nr:hypothetical protein [Planococcus sp. ISL-109]MBT2582854.1 hypothetical protein [Planococcus sp. ISL-109]
MRVIDHPFYAANFTISFHKYQKSQFIEKNTCYIIEESDFVEGAFALSPDIMGAAVLIIGLIVFFVFRNRSK